MTPSHSCLSEPGVQRLDRVRRVNHPPDLWRVVQEGHELGPRCRPQSLDRRILGSPDLVELVESADSVDILMAFVRTSGINLHMRELQRLVDRGGRLRILTTTYTGSTQREALDKLAALGDNVEIKVSYSTQSTRLHAKSWLFHRDSGFSTGMVGSSNLTHQAQVTGMEWNVRVSSVTTPGVLERLGATFDSYWHRDEFEPYDPAVFADRVERSRTVDGRIDISHFDVRPYAFQQRILDQIEIERTEHGYWKNLVVAATELARARSVGMTFHLSPSTSDTEQYLATTGRAPLLHLDALGVLGAHLAIGHGVHLDDDEIDGCRAQPAGEEIVGAVLGDGEYFWHSAAFDDAFATNPAEMLRATNVFMDPSKWRSGPPLRIRLWAAADRTAPRDLGEEGSDDWLDDRDPEGTLRSELVALGAMDDGSIDYLDSAALFERRAMADGVDVRLDVYPGGHTTTGNVEAIVDHLGAVADAS